MNDQDQLHPRAAIAQQRLHNQRMVGSLFQHPAEVVQWLGAVQAQDFAGARWALGLRMDRATDNDIGQAFNEGAILRTHLLRPTWHFVTPADIHWLLALTAPRVHLANAPYYRKLELDQALFQRSHKVLRQALQGGNQLTRDQLRDVLEQADIRTAGELRMVYILMQAELDGIICSGARRGKQFTYALLSERAPQAKTLGRDEALAELAHRYFFSRGPATVHDFAKWSGLTVTDARVGLESVQTHLHVEVVGRQSYWFAPAPIATRPGTPTALLLSVYDEYFSSYKDWRAIVDDPHAQVLVALDNALTGIVVVDGQIAGTWKRKLQKDTVIVKTDPFVALSEAENQAVALAAHQLGAYLGLSVVLA
jgi:hypothetical protein